MAEAKDEAGRLERARRDRLGAGRRGGWGGRDLSVLMRAQIPEFRRLRRSLAGVAEAWNEVVPEPLASSARLDGVSAGVLNVRVADASARFYLDRFLRAGGEAELLKRMPMSIRRIKIGLSDPSQD